MIRINLLRAPGKKKKAKSPVHIDVRRIVLLITSVVVLVIVAAGVAVVSRVLATHKPRAPRQQVAVVPTQFKPTTHVTPNMVEDVVKEVGEERTRTIASGFLDVAYSEMSTAEKINYETLHMKYVTELLGRAVPSGIGLKKLDIDNFQTIYAVGIGPSREQISTMLSSLKQERVDLMPPPYSYVKANEGNGYRFLFTCKTRFGLDLTDQFQAIDFLPSRDDVELLAKKVQQYAIGDGITVKGAPVQVSAEKIGPYRRIMYHLSGNCSYKNFVKFTMHLYKDRIPCAVKKLTLTAKSGNIVEVSIDCIFTARD
jgi:hypothetical protein